MEDIYLFQLILGLKNLLLKVVNSYYLVSIKDIRLKLI